MEGHEVLALGGPLSGDPNIRVAEGEDGWPKFKVWRTGPGPDERHLYEHTGTAIDPSRGGVPTYEFVRTLGPDEPNPE